MVLATLALCFRGTLKGFPMLLTRYARRQPPSDQNRKGRPELLISCFQAQGKGHNIPLN